jgi:SH3-like domain-containing protein
MAYQHLRICFLLLMGFAICRQPGVAAGFPASYPNMPNTNDEKYAVVTATSLNIRSEPSTKGSIVTKAAKGAKLEVMGEEGEWYKVKTPDGKTGWASKSYLALTAAQKEAVAAPQEKTKPMDQPAPKTAKPHQEAAPRSFTGGPAAAYGVLGGIAFSHLAGENISDEFSSRFGFTAGALAYFPLNHFIGIQPELVYAQKGAVKNSGGIESTLQFDYIDLPILLRINLPVGRTLSPYITVGPLLSYNIQAIVTDNGSTLEITDLKKLDYGVSAGGGLQFILLHQTFLIDARYYLGLAQIHDAETNPLDLKNNCLTVAVGWLF